MDSSKKTPGGAPETLLKKKETVEKDPAIEEALNKSGFAQFLALHTDAEEVLQGGPRAEEVITVFEKKDHLIEMARKMLSDQIGKEIGTEGGLELSTEELGAIDGFLSKMAVEDSEGFLKLVGKTETFEANSASIQKSQDQLRALGGFVEPGAIDAKRTELQAKMEVLQGVQGTNYIDSSMNNLRKWIGVRPVFLNGSLDANRTAAQEKYGLEKDSLGNFKDIPTQMAATRDLMRNLDQQLEITQGLVELQDLKKSLLGEIFPGTLLGPIIQKKVEKYLSDLSLSTKLEELEQAQAFMEKAGLASKQSEVGADYVGAVHKADTQEIIDAGMEKAVADKVNEAINKSTLGDKALARLESSLQAFIKRETLGSKDKGEYRDFLVGLLETQVKDLSAADQTSKAKAMLIKRIIIKINNA